MNQIAERLTGCFAAVFPDLPPEQISQADQGKLDAWDSIASLTLVAVIEEEFRCSLDIEQIPELTSFAKIASYLASQPAA